MAWCLERGFFPFWVGVGLIGFSLANLVRSVRGIEVLDETLDLEGFLKALGIVVAIVSLILTAPFFGLRLGSGLFILATAFVIRPRWTTGFATRIVAVAIGFPIFGHFLFGVYLRVPLVEGVFGF
ncbi:MAG: tripartite tricarboxylate transporter TctB family protein [Acidobacteria bacterium]|nr:tripartite tricarboxylate transporter TctB family protein [Acidobacteriota bacterium]